MSLLINSVSSSVLQTASVATGGTSGKDTFVNKARAGGSRATPGANLASSNMSIHQMRNRGLTPAQLIEAGYTIAEIKSVGYKAQEFQGACTLADLRDARYTAHDLKIAGHSANDLRICGYEPPEMRRAGFTAIEMKEGGFDIKDMKEGGYFVFDVLNTGYTVQEAKVGRYHSHVINYYFSIFNNTVLLCILITIGCRLLGYRVT